MKQKIYIFGVVTVLIVFAGTIFKVNHWAGAGILLTVGLANLILLFLPAALINHYKAEENRQNLSLYIVTWLTCFVVFTAMLFKIMHWPYAGIFLTVALPFPYVVFLPVFLGVTSKNKNFNIYNTVFVLLLLVLNSVFSALLSLNVTKVRIDDSYNLSRNYNKLETALSHLPLENPQSPVSMRIDEVLKIVNEYQDLILKQEGISVEQWKNDPGNLLRPDSKRVAVQALLNAGESPVGTKLANGLKGLISVMENTQGYEGIAKVVPAIFDLEDPAGFKQNWAIWKFNDNSLAWVLIYLDGLEANLLMIKNSSGTIGF
jgi:hypothetical protein